MSPEQTSSKALNPDDYRDLLTIAIQDGTPEEPVTPSEPEPPVKAQ